MSGCDYCQSPTGYCTCVRSLISSSYKRKAATAPSTSSKPIPNYVMLTSLPGGDDKSLWARIDEVFGDPGGGMLTLALVKPDTLRFELPEELSEELLQALRKLEPGTLIGLASDLG